MKDFIIDLLKKLKELISEERKLMISSDYKGLMNLLSHKLAILEQIESISHKEDILRSVVSDENVRRILEEIRRENELTRLFAEEMLDIYDDISSVLVPALYNSCGSRRSIQSIAKGTSVSIEV